MRIRIGEWGVKRMWRFSLVVLILVSCTSCDRVTKNMAREWLVHSPPISVLNDFVQFEYVENLGAFLGLGSNLPREVRFALLVVLASVSLALTLALMTRVHKSGLKPLIGLSFLAGGGAGNLIDRIINKCSDRFHETGNWVYSDGDIQCSRCGDCSGSGDVIAVECRGEERDKEGRITSRWKTLSLSKG